MVNQAKTKNKMELWIECTPEPDWYVLKGVSQGMSEDVCIANGKLEGLETLKRMILKKQVLITTRTIFRGRMINCVVGGNLGLELREGDY